MPTGISTPLTSKKADGSPTGALYHHFGSKLGLYDLMRDDVERRLLDRMEGAIAASARAPRP
jgi:AcrR family transcriptional regulator